MLDEENEETPIVDDGNGEVPTEETPTTDDETTDEESTSIISVEELKKRLRLAGVDFSNYTDDDLQTLIDLTLETIEAVTGLPIINPRLITEYEDFFHSKVYETDYYPLLCCEIRLNDELVEAHRIDMHLGIIYFRPGVTGDLEVKYQIQYTDATVLSSLIANMIALTIEGDSVHGTWNSIREGEVSVTYGAGSGGLQEKTDKTLAELKGYYKPRVRLL
jgi:hypothetical protein